MNNILKLQSINTNKNVTNDNISNASWSFCSSLTLIC